MYTFCVVVVVVFGFRVSKLDCRFPIINSNRQGIVVVAHTLEGTRRNLDTTSLSRMMPFATLDITRSEIPKAVIRRLAQLNFRRNFTMYNPEMYPERTVILPDVPLHYTVIIFMTTYATLACTQPLHFPPG